MVELVLRVQQAWVEPVSDALADELGALAVSLEDADAHTPAEQAIFGEPGLPAPQAAWPQSTLRALFDSEQAATDALTLLLAQDDSAQALQVQALVPVPDADWVRLTQSQFAPVAVTPTFWIVPSWHDAPAPARTVLRLDPGLAFGTGTHPTTRMCLRWIADNAQPWPRVLDYGCGSGILAIAAALHGANGVDAVDIDAAAVASTRANAAHNGVRVSAGLPSAAHGRYALVLANILAKPLVLLAPLLCRHVAPGGQLVLAGILERQADELTAAYAPACALRVTDRDDGWVLMTATFDGGPR
jgi:ribosomal protein L11 methyltransferase